MLRSSLFTKMALLVLMFVASAAFAQSKATPSPSDKQPEGWDIESPPGEQWEQQIDVTEGTWINLDVSPNGKWIVFDLLGDLYLMPASGADGKKGGRPKKLTSGISWDMQPRFSPDGSKVAFTSDRKGINGKAGDNIWVISLADKKMTQVTAETFRLLSGPAWSPDGKTIVARKHFTSRRSLGAGEMWLYHLDGLEAGAGSGLQLTKRPNDQKDVNEPIFSPDGKYLFFSRDTTTGSTFEYDKDSNKEIYTVRRLDLSSGSIEPYITGPGGACRPTPSPDGKLIAFVRRIGPKTGLHIFDTRSGAVRLVYDKLERDMQEAWAIHGVYPSFAWTPDKKSIVIWAKGKIRRINVKSGKATIVPFHIKDKRQMTRRLRFPIEVAPDRFDVKMLRWVRVAPNGKFVVYQALGHVYLRTLPNGKPRRLTDQKSVFEFFPTISRDSRYVALVSWHDERLGEIRVVSTDSKRPESWVVTAEPGHYANPVFSPNGKTIVFEKRGGGMLTSPLWSRDPGLYRVAVKGGKPKRITKSGRRPAFANHSDRVYFQKEAGGKDADNLGLYSIALDGSDERQHYTSKWGTDYCVSPDGEQIAFVERFNVYVAPFVQTGTSITVGPTGNGLPVRRVSEQAGEWVHFSGDGKRLYWSLGPDLYQIATTGGEQKPGKPLAIGFARRHQRPNSKYALVGGTIITMAGDSVIKNGVLLVNANRIKAVGSRKDVKIPKDYKVINIPNQVVLPGYVDTHAHGPLASNEITPQKNWVNYARLAFGVTTIHDPSNNTQTTFASSELTKAGMVVGPRTFSTGTILYGAAGSYKAEVNGLDDARFHLKRMKAVGAFSVKSYNQPRRDQRQQVVAAARELKMMVVPEGGSTFMHNMTMIVDGHTGIEHTLPVQTAYDDVMDLWRKTEVGYTPTLSVAYGGISGEQYWYEHDDLWLHPRLKTFIPPHVLNPRSRRRNKSPREDYNHIRVAEIAKQVVRDQGLVQAGGHGQLNGICTHWEMWSFVQGGMTPMEALRCGTLYGAKYLGLHGDIGSIEAGKLADVIVIEKGADPTKSIRDSEKVEYVMANGRLYEANRMNELGQPAPRSAFYWEHLGSGISTAIPRARSCNCHRPGAWGWMRQ